MRRIYLARHGQDQDNAQGILNGRRDQPLTEKGIEQAKEVADKIKQTDIRFDKIYSSPLQRAYATALIISQVLEMEKPEILPELIERNFGVMTGQPQAGIEERCAPHTLKTETITYFLSPEGAETFPQLIKRAQELLASFKRTQLDGTDILLVTHGDFGKMLYAAYYNLDWMEVLKMFHFGNSELLELSEDSKPEDAHVFRIQQHNA